MSNEEGVWAYADTLTILSNPNLFSALLIYTSNCLFHISMEMPRSLKITMAKLNLMLFPQSLTSLVTNTTTFPVVKEEKVRGCPYFRDSSHSFASSTNSSIFTPKIYLYLLLSFHLYCYHLISNRQNLSTVLGPYLIYLFPFLPPCSSFFYKQGWSS